ncbi:unnamed protein product [Amoebophrya sp. A25]|nr:unnamed protein product [Amoebophrya sp. A25]|eukprot:GSA25T00024010001.1
MEHNHGGPDQEVQYHEGMVSTLHTLPGCRMDSVPEIFPNGDCEFGMGCGVQTERPGTTTQKVPSGNRFNYEKGGIHVMSFEAYGDEETGAPPAIKMWWIPRKIADTFSEKEKQDGKFWEQRLYGTGPGASSSGEHQQGEPQQDKPSSAEGVSSSSSSSSSGAAAGGDLEKPYVVFPMGTDNCPLKEFWGDQTVIINTDFCGSMAGNTWKAQSPEPGAGMKECQKAVGSDDYAKEWDDQDDALLSSLSSKWIFRSLRVFNLEGQGRPYPRPDVPEAIIV